MYEQQAREQAGGSVAPQTVAVDRTAFGVVALLEPWEMADRIDGALRVEVA